MNRRRLLLPTALLTVAAVAIFVPRGDVSAEGERTLVILEEDEPQTTYPFLARTMSESRLAELLFDRLFTESSGGSLKSNVFGEGWEVKSPNLSVTVQDDLKFANGSQATFSDVTFTLNDVYRRQDVGHDQGSWYAKVFGDAQQITPMVGKVKFGIPVPDEGAEKYLLTTVMLSREALSKEGGKPDLERTKRQPVGTGPFYAAATIESFDDVRLTRNPHRPGKTGGDRKPVQKLRLQYDQDGARQRELMEGGRADIWVSPPPAVLPSFKNQNTRYGIKSYQLNQWWFVALNHSNDALKDPRVREALDLAVPRGQLVEKFGGDSARLTSGPFLPTSAWQPGDSKPTAEDRARATKLMEEAGYSKQGGVWTKGGEAVSLRWGVQGDLLDDYTDVVYGMNDAWEEAGFNVRVRPIRTTDWREKVEGGEADKSFDLILGRWNIDREEAVLDLFSKVRDGDRQVNLFAYDSAEVGGIVEAYYKETSGPKREALMQKLHRYLHSDRPYLFLWTLEVQSVYRRDRLAGFRATPFYYFTRAEELTWKADAPD